MAAPFLLKKRKSGVILPLAAVIAGAIIALIIILGIDTKFAKGARAKASLHLEEACRQAARQLPNTRNALEVFQGQMRVFFTPKSMGGLGGIPLAQNISIKMTSPSFSRVLSANPNPFLNETNCPFPNANSIACRFYGNLDRPNVASNFPLEPFWNLTASSKGRRNAIMGDALACELSFDMTSFMHDSTRVMTRSVWQLKPRGAGANKPISDLPILGPRGQHGGGLLIGIATEMGVRLKRTGGAINTRYLLNDPTADPVTPLGANSNVFRANRVARSWSSISLLPSLAIPPATSNTGNLPLEERRATCANPAVFARNLMLNAIVERASRGWLRDKTEIVSINPIVYGSASPTTSNEPPTIIVKGGLDLTLAQYELPALTYREIRGGAPTYINPASRGALNTPQNNDRERFGELRDCYYVYNASSGGIIRPYDYTVANYTGTQAFEPTIISRRTEAAQPAPRYDVALTQNWDQTPGSSRALTAGQVVSMLGASRHCPSGPTFSYPPSGSGSPISGSCSESAMRTTTSVPFTDLRPDIINFLDFALTRTRAHASPGPATPTSPGTGTENTFSNFSHVLLFTHVPITELEVTEISNRVRELNILGRYVTVVYIPTNFLDATDTEVTRLKRAFLGADPTIPGSQSSKNIVFHIWPDSSGFSASPSLEDREFRNFWSNLISKSTADNALSRAKWLWLPRLMYEELKF